MSEQLDTKAVEAEISISTNGGGGSTPMNGAEFVDYLKANGFKGNTGINANSPEKVWISFTNNP